MKDKPVVSGAEEPQELVNGLGQKVFWWEQKVKEIQQGLEGVLGDVVSEVERKEAAQRVRKSHRGACEDLFLAKEDVAEGLTGWLVKRSCEALQRGLGSKEVTEIITLLVTLLIRTRGSGLCLRAAVVEKIKKNKKKRRKGQS